MECNICLAQFNQTTKRAMLILPCCHCVCNSCLEQIKRVSNKCPNCKRKIEDSTTNWYVHSLTTNNSEKKAELVKLINDQKEFEAKINSSIIISTYLIEQNIHKVKKKYAEYLRELQVLKNKNTINYFIKFAELYNDEDVCIKKIRRIIEIHSELKFILPLVDIKKILFWDFDHFPHNTKFKKRAAFSLYGVFNKYLLLSTGTVYYDLHL